MMINDDQSCNTRLGMMQAHMHEHMRTRAMQINMVPRFVFVACMSNIRCDITHLLVGTWQLSELLLKKISVCIKAGSHEVLGAH